MPRTLITAIFVVFLALIADGSAQTPPIDAKGLLVCKDLQTGYVEIIEYTSSSRVNDYTCRYNLVSGNTRQIQDKAVTANIKYPVPGTAASASTQTQANLEELTALTRKYPQYTALLNAATARLQNFLANTPKPDRSTPQSTGKTPPAITLTLKDGTVYQDVRVTRVGPDSLTIMHRSGVLEILFSNLPDDLAGLPDGTRNSIVEARKARNEANRSADERALAKGALPPPTNPSTLADVPLQREKSIADQKQKLAEELSSAEKEADRASQDYAKANPKGADASDDVGMLTFIVERKLNKVEFGGKWPAGSEIYEIHFPASDGGGVAILQTNDTSFRSTGRATMFVGLQETMEVEMKSGFDRRVAVYVEVPAKEVAALNAARAQLRRLKAAADEAKTKSNAAKDRLQLFDYATAKFSTIHLVPTCHVSVRLQALGFEARVASARWNRVIDLAAQADWPKLVKEALGAEVEMTTRAEVDNAFDRLTREPVAVVVKSNQVHLSMRPGNDAGYLERPGPHRTVSVGALSLPTSPTDLLNPLNGNRVDLGTLPAVEDLRENLLPDGSGYVARWTPKDADLYLCAYVFSPNAGEKAVSAEFDALRRSVLADASRVIRRKESGQIAEADTTKELGRTLGDLYAFARGPLMTDY